MNKEYLISLGLTEEQAIQVLAQFDTDVANLPNTTDLQARVTDLETQLDDRDKQLEDLGDFEGTVEDLKAEITRLEQENDGKDAEWQSKLNSQKLDHAIDQYLNGVGAKSVVVIKKMVDLESVTLNEDGSLGGIEDQIKSLKEEHAYLFEDEEDKKKKDTKLKITTGNHSKTGTEDDFVKGLLG